MIDIHTHILPCVDDGSQSVEESLKMLEIMQKSDITTVVATPHYYNDIMTLQDFLERRQSAFEKIREANPYNVDILLGAEVLLAYNLHKEDLRKLAIQGTDYILIEMPYSKWDPWVFEELFKISAKHELQIIIAHIDRYADIASKDNINHLFEMDLKYQVNVNSLGGFFKKSYTIEMLKKRAVHFLGSDCHNLTSRKPCLGDGIKKIESKAGRKCVEYCMDNAKKMLENKNI